MSLQAVARVQVAWPRMVILLSALVILGATNPASFGQLLPRYEKLRVIALHYSNTAGEKAVTRLNYGRDGVLRHGLWSLEDGSRFSGNYHLYDQAGLEVEKYREFSDGLTSVEFYSYDESGRRTLERFERSDGRKGTARFQWDEQGRLGVTVCDNHKGWLTGRIEYTYQDGRLSSASITRDGQPAGAISYRYDPAGHLVEETWRLGDKFSQSFRYEYEPVPRRLFAASSPLLMVNPRFVVASEDYRFNSEEGGPSTYTYEDQSKLVKKVFRRSDGVETTTTYEYDPAGNLVSSDRVYADGRRVQFSYLFDRQLRMVSKKFRRSDGIEGSEEYRYDRLGRLASAKYENMDFWLSGTISFTHDLRGYLAGGHFDGADDFDAELEIETDDHGNPTRVHWIFSFNRTQTYTYDYQLVSPAR